MSKKELSHKPILDVPLYPPAVTFFCSECANHNKHVHARYWIVDPEGKAISKVCSLHGTSTIFQYRNNDLLGWTLHEISHGQADDRKAHVRPTTCGHSTCAQVFIDTGSNACVETES